MSEIEKFRLESNPNIDEVELELLKDINYSWKQLKLDLEQLKDWLRDQHHLPECRLTASDNFLMHYLTGCKGSLETVKRKLDAYYSLRGKSEIYSNRDPLDEEYRKTCDIFYSDFLPKLTEGRNSVIVCKLASGEIFPSLVINHMKRVISCAEIGVNVGPVAVPTIFIVDYEGFTATHAMYYTPGHLKDFIHVTQEAFPSRLQKIILINAPSFLDLIINSVVKPFLTKKLRDRVIVTSEGWEEVFKYVDKSVIPKDCGGDFHMTLKEINDVFNEYEITHRDWYINELSQQTDETKRVNTDFKYSDDSYFGVQGTLKKLSID